MDSETWSRNMKRDISTFVRSKHWLTWYDRGDVMSHLNLEALNVVVAFMYRLGVAGMGALFASKGRGWGIWWTGMGTLFLSEGCGVWRWVMRPCYLLWTWLDACIAHNSVRYPIGTLHKAIWRSGLMENMFCILCVGISEENGRNQSTWHQIFWKLQ